MNTSITRRLTKSLFTSALECPTALYYATHAEYPSQKDEDDFLLSLAKGGMQVGTLACQYYPEGIAIETLDTQDALSQTDHYLQRDNVTLFEAAISSEESFLVRVDILVKDGTAVDLIEVKSKSYDADTTFLKQDGTIRTEWRPYIYDVAFQYWVVTHAHPEWEVTPWLMLVDKEKPATVDGLHQRFRVQQQSGRYTVRLKPGTSRADLGEPILTRVNVREAVQRVLHGQGMREAEKEPIQQAGFDSWVRTLATSLQQDRLYPITLGKKCKGCAFRISPSKLRPGQRSGFANCWRQVLGWDAAAVNQPHIFDLWYGNQDVDRWLAQQKYHLHALTHADLPAAPETVEKQHTWNRANRQTVQILMETGQIAKDEIILDGLQEEIAGWTWPLHLIDFEALQTAIPFQKGRHPYERIAFQFSCHTLYPDKRVEHRAEWIAREPGIFPNYQFVRHLKQTLESHPGTLFRYHYFETTVLKNIREQLLADQDTIPDANELIVWINTLLPDGPRELVDLHQLTQAYYYHRAMHGSISIKDVLPAILQTSTTLREKYTRPYSGLNFTDMIWWQQDASGQVSNPYTLLPPIPIEGTPEYGEGEERIADGGSAMMAFARMQFHDVTPEQRAAIVQALLQYCELDTLAMVMLVEHWLGHFDL